MVVVPGGILARRRNDRQGARLTPARGAQHDAG